MCINWPRTIVQMVHVSYMPCHRLTALLCLSLAIAARLTAVAAYCQTKCGGVEIPYPFGVGTGCAKDGFELSCDDTGNGEPKPFYKDVELLSIALLPAQVRMRIGISSYCYDTTSGQMDEQNGRNCLNLQETPYRFSDTGNKFIVIGSRALAYVSYQDDTTNLTTGCVSTCRQDDLAALTDGTCSGIGCCQKAIPKGLQYYYVRFDENFNTTNISNMSRCGYAALMEASNFTFSPSYVMNSSAFNDTYGGKAPLLVDWAIGRETCDEVARNKTGYACVSNNSECFNSPNGQGYICNCSKGFQGNPYLRDGCQDIDECMDRDKYPCYGTCDNKPGSYDCFCPSHTRGDASVGPCMKELTQGVQLAIGICSTALLGLFIFLGMEWIKYKRRIICQDTMRKRDAYFHQHGGQLLIDMMTIESNMSFKLYDREKIELATNNFDDRAVIGEGGQGTVYKGYDLDPDNNPVAIKRCKGFGENRKMEFGQELLILSRVNHGNIVKLLGCCLQFEVPVLVYEFVPNKTLYYLIHVQNGAHIRTLDIRLKIAAESAEALAYLHSLDHPIFHGDVKSSNILLGENLKAKVSDFGCSMIRPMDDGPLVVKGTMGYLDPEYLLKFQLTDKSDVYSFGVVLLELLTRKKPLSKEKESLASVFQAAVKEGCLDELVDREIAEEDNMDLVHQVAQLASRCLAMTGEKRPAMSRVAEELRRLAKLVKQRPWAVHGVGPLMVSGSSSADTSECGTWGETTEYYSIKRKATMSIEFAK